MARTFDDFRAWVDARGGVDGKGLDLLEIALAQLQFRHDDEPVGREFIRIERQRLEERRARQEAERRDADRAAREIADQETEQARAQREAEEAAAERLHRAAQRTLDERAVTAAESQAASARKALRISWLALFVSLAAIALTAYDLSTRSP